MVEAREQADGHRRRAPRTKPAERMDGAWAEHAIRRARALSERPEAALCAPHQARAGGRLKPQHALRDTTGDAVHGHLIRGLKAPDGPRGQRPVEAVDGARRVAQTEQPKLQPGDGGMVAPVETGARRERPRASSGVSRARCERHDRGEAQREKECASALPLRDVEHSRTPRFERNPPDGARRLTVGPASEASAGLLEEREERHRPPEGR
jgi:hypothetical protein